MPIEPYAAASQDLCRSQLGTFGNRSYSSSTTLEKIPGRRLGFVDDSSRHVLGDPIGDEPYRMSHLLEIYGRDP